ncbi:MAG: hypothetical protein ACYTGL_23395 [Planctomycetota bacterium]
MSDSLLTPPQPDLKMLHATCDSCGIAFGFISISVLTGTEA